MIPTIGPDAEWRGPGSSLDPIGGPRTVGFPDKARFATRPLVPTFRPGQRLGDNFEIGGITRATPDPGPTLGLLDLA